MIKRILLILSLITPAIMFSGCGGDTLADQKSTIREIPVKLRTVQTHTFIHSLEVNGSLESRYFTMVPAQVGGTIQEFFVHEGDTVTAGQKLCRLDDVKLGRSLEVSQQSLAVAAEAVNVSEAQLDKARADVSKAKKDYQRYEKLLADEAISETEFEQVENMYVAAKAGHKAARAQLELSHAQYGQAEAALSISRRSYNDTVITSPIDGVVSHSLYELGEMAENGKPVFRIDDPSVLELSVFVPGSYYGNIIPHTTSVRIETGKTDLGTCLVNYKSPTVDPMLRTFEVKCQIANPPENVVAGLLSNAVIELDSRKGIGVPDSAVIQRAETAVIFLIQDDTAQEVPVKTGMKTGGFTEIVDGLTDASVQVVVSGQTLLNDGSPVRIITTEM